MVLKNNVLDAIKANLPAASAEAMKEYFAAHEKLEKDFEEMESERDTLNSLWTQESAKVRALNSYKDRLEEIEEKEKTIAVTETNLEIRTKVLVVKEECAALRIADCKGMFNTVFRNTELRTEVLKKTAVKAGAGINYGNNGEIVPVDGGEALEENDEVKTITES